MRKPKHKRGKRYPEPGEWVDDHTHGLPDMSESIVVSKERRLTSEEIRDYVSQEGLGHCIYELILPDSIGDDKLRELWLQARACLFDIVTYLQTIPEKRTTKKGLRPSKKAPQKPLKAVDVGYDLV